jgi:hypothetical protein
MTWCCHFASSKTLCTVVIAYSLMNCHFIIVISDVVVVYAVIHTYIHIIYTIHTYIQYHILHTLYCTLPTDCTMQWKIDFWSQHSTFIFSICLFFDNDYGTIISRPISLPQRGYDCLVIFNHMVVVILAWFLCSGCKQRRLVLGRQWSKMSMDLRC